MFKFLKKNTRSTHTNIQSPLIRTIKRHLKDLRVVFMMFIIIWQIPPGETSQTRFRGITQYLTLLKWYVGFVEFDLGVKGADVDHLSHSRRGQ